MPVAQQYWSDGKKRALLVAFFGAAALLLFCYRYLEFAARHEPVDWRVPFIEQFTGVYALLALLPGIKWVARRWPPRRSRIPALIAVHAGAIVALAFAHTSLMAISRQVVFRAFGFGPYDYGDMRVRYWMEGSQDVILYGVIVALIWLIDRYQASRDLEVSRANLETELAHAQLRNLQLQLQPHFLFNALNTISSVMYDDVAAADAMITRLSEFLRLTLRGAEAQEVRLSDELELLDAYLSIMRARFEDRLAVRLRIDAETRSAFVPQLILQPLVENSIRHGADLATNSVAIEIDAHRENGTLRLSVRDHGPGMQREKEGVGLANTRSRLNHLYGPAHKFALRNAPEGGLDVLIEVPYRQ